MDEREKDHIKLRIGLALWRLLEEKKAVGARNRQEGVKDSKLVDSYLKLERASGLPKATLIGIFQGRINAASSSLWAILEALGASFTTFGKVLDGISEADLGGYREILKKNRQAQQQKAKKAAANKRKATRQSTKKRQ
jgi:transcriptional regulator with XRE-family HTH domain